MQYKAGYFLTSIYDLFINQSEKEKAEKIVKQLSHFQLETSDELAHQNVDYISEIKTVNNIISRGTPTLPSSYIEDILATSFGQTKKEISKLNHISYPFKNDSLADEIFRALHIIDPRINKENQSIYFEEEWKNKKKSLKLDFKYSYIPEYLGQAFIQLVEEERTYHSLIKSTCYRGLNSEIEADFSEILEKKCNFVLEMPYQHQDSFGMPIELDDTPTETKYDHEIELLKQAYCKKLGLSEPLIIDTHRMAESNQQMRPLIDFTYNEYFDTIGKNYRSPLYKSTEGLQAMQYALTPLAISRIEKAVVEYLLSGKLSLKDATWNIAVIERDVPCAHLAFQDLKLHFENLFALKGEKITFPEIKLNIYRTQEFKNAKLNVIYPGNIKFVENFDSEAPYDLLIDVSVLQRVGIKNEPYETQAKNKVIIRSVKSIKSEHNLLTDKSIKYLDFNSKRLDETKKDKAHSALKYFLRNIFRKDLFLPGQVELINEILQKNNTLALLPTGGGKTIAYQLAGLLQPGVNIIVNPIMSVMIDQSVALKKSGIDSILSINASLKIPELLEKQVKQLENGNCQFAFVSPDYLRKKELRNACYSMEYNKVYINQLVIDEAHCISEWSHDFRPFYSKLGDLKLQLLKNKTKQSIPAVALTATAGYTCVNEIKKELKISDNSVINAPVNEAKLNFKVIDTTSNQIKADMNIGQIENLVGGRKQVHFSFLVKDLFPENRDKSERKDTVIFCPTAYGKTGVSDQFGDGLADKLKNNFENLKIGCFWGTTDDGSDNVPLFDAQKSEKDYTEFINNQLDILVSTSAFGIGTNKHNIRNIIYFSPPSSVEGFIQQSYRAGRDGETTNCSVVIDKQEFIVSETDPVGKYLPDHKSNFDRYLSYKEIIKKYKGKEKELCLINELLYDLTSYSTTYRAIINQELKNEYQVDIVLELQPANNPNRLYLNQDDNTYGYVDLINLKINSEGSSFEQQYSQELLQFVVNEVKKRSFGTNEYAKILQSNPYTQPIESITKGTEKLVAGSVKELIIPFENSALVEISEMLTKEVSASFNQKKIRDLYQASDSYNSFIEKIEKIKSISSKKKLIEKVQELYEQVRLKEDTHLAIYRLSKLGFIEDYLVDELNYQFILKVKKQNIEAHLLRLYDIFDDSLVPEKAVEYKMLLSKTEDDKIKVALESYIDFCYNFIVKERFNSIETLHEIISQIPENKSLSKEVNQHIKNYFDNYFQAKYTNAYFGAKKGTSPLNSNEQNFKVIKDYLDNMGLLKENWSQLKKSTEVVSKQMPDNFVPYLLGAYTNLAFGEKDEKIIDESFDQIARGLIKMRKQNGYQLENYQKDIQTFLGYINETRPDLKETAEQIIWLRMHYIWLKDFNKGLKTEVGN
jgi:RecQ family ATP-dependent DNA helicase